MSIDTLLLCIIAALVAGRIWQAWAYHAQSTRLLNDLATMLGDWWDWQEKRDA